MIGELIGGVTHDDELDVVLATVRREAPSAIVRQVVENVAFVATGERHDECVDLLRSAAEPDEPSTRNAHLYESLVQAIGNADGSSFRATVVDYRVTARGNHAHAFAAESAAAVVEFWDGRTRAGYRRGLQVMVDALPHRPQSSWSGAFVWAATRAFVLGRPAVLEPFARECSQRYRVAMFDGALAWVEASRGDPSRIRARVERRSPARVRALTMPRLGGPAHWMTVLACVADGTPPSIDYARELVDLVDGSAFHAMPHNPSPALAQLSARVALVEGDLDRAIDDARRAVDDYRSMTAHVFVPAALADLAGALRRRGRIADGAEADVADAEAASTTRRLRARPIAAG